jgi:hypothetical protein
MSNDWSSARLKKATLGKCVGRYEAMSVTPQEAEVKKQYPEMFTFDAVSIGDKKGQAFLVPLDDSSKETAEYILRAIAAYTGA